MFYSLVDNENAPDLHGVMPLGRMSLLHDPDHVREMMTEAKRLAPEISPEWDPETAASTERPRFVKSHLPMSLNPPDLLTKAKVTRAAC